ncbi:hypothetical protein IQ269_19220 [Tychonema sp. LEGE 07199]|uniref:hypothetical protein n=1 Tax=unclassified Tychonema TaxID=2642144 RepID=UPI00188104B3|nr:MULTISPECIES: hypothetical protein [unclassified Tychonema]MBE9122869.1 hypothetical protein [Tychonema sp. LEGE 07199]MBE9134724.1 hypothetical protein [Tychonema sp. LEGE 07196]
MSKINFNTENPEIEITRAIGKKSEGKITLNTEGGSIEIDLGFASVGATTDYGGAISVGLLGQEITWGREGGTIHIGIGGFAVDVEAKDCIVTEVKSIAGIIVAQRSYPDPGCKLPEPPKPPPEPIVDPDPNVGVAIPATAELMWVPCTLRRTSYNTFGKISGLSESRVTIANKEEKEVSAQYLPFEQVTRQIAWSPTGGERETSSYRTPKNIYVYKSTVILGRGDPRFGSNAEIAAVQSYDTSFYGKFGGFFDTGVNIKNFIATNDRNNAKYLSFPGVFTYGNAYTFTYKPVDYIIVGTPKPAGPFLPTGNKPPMKDCCEEILDMLEDIKEAFAVDRLLKDKFPVSNTFMAPGCDPASVTQAKNYYEISQCLMRMMAHGMIFEPRVNIKDADAAKAGDQEFKAKYLNATGWASAVAEALLEVKDDGNVSTNMDIRNGFAATQTMVGLADAIYRLNAILDGMGVELIPKIETVDTPYNVQVQIGKGFGEGNERQIDLNTDEATESLLPTFLQVKRNKIKTVDIHPRSRSLKEILESIEAHLPSNNNG